MCYYPTLIQNKKYTETKKNGGVIPAVLDKRVLAVPIGCGNCMECRKAKAREWQVRLLEDVRHERNGKFITLTFSNESIKELAEEVTTKTTKIQCGIKSSWVDKNGKLCYRYKYKKIKEKIILKGYETDNAIATMGMRRFLESWRKEYGKSLRHWFITELGHKNTENIHMHGIAWTDEDVKKIEKHWKYGYVWIGDKIEKKIKNYVTEKTVNYITKYVQKMDFDHMEYKPVILTSAGIGKGYFNRIDWERNKYNEEETKEYFVTRTGHKMALPIYWRNKIYSDEEREKLWLMKLDKEVRYIGGEKIDVSEDYENYYKTLKYHRKVNERMGYGTSTIEWNRKKYEEDRRNLLIQERIATAEEKEMLRRGLRPDATAGESVNNSLRSAECKREIGWSEEQIIWGKNVNMENGENNWWE